MYNDIKLEKGLYGLSQKSFTQALSELDPDSNYIGTEIEGLDAFERQLKRFNIKISGSDCDVVDKFFTTTESAVLFPEFVRRAILSGMDLPVLEEIVAVNSRALSSDYRPFAIENTQGADCSEAIAEGDALPETTISQASAISTAKLGRIISTTYEAIRFQKLDLFACTLRRIGAQLANDIAKNAINTLVEDADIKQGTEGGFEFSDLLALYGLFEQYDLTTLIASPSTCAALMSLPGMEECESDDGGISVKLPFGPKLYKAKSYTGTGVIGIDKKFALQMITDSDLLLETDKLINKQLDRITVSIRFAFSKMFDDAVKVLAYSES